MTVEDGGRVPEPLYLKIPGLIPELASPHPYIQRCAAAYWQGWYLLSWPRYDEVLNSETLLLHTLTGAFYNLSDTGGRLAAGDYCVWDGPGDGGELYACDNVTGDLRQVMEMTNRTYSYYDTAVGVACSYLTKALDLASTPEELYQVKTIDRLVLCFLNLGSAQNLYLDIYTNGDTATETWTGGPYTIAASMYGERAYVCVQNIAATGRAFQVRVYGTFDNPIELEWMQIRYTMHDESQGVSIG